MDALEAKEVDGSADFLAGGSVVVLDVVVGKANRGELFRAREVEDAERVDGKSVEAPRPEVRLTRGQGCPPVQLGDASATRMGQVDGGELVGRVPPAPEAVGTLPGQGRAGRGHTTVCRPRPRSST